MDGVHDMGGMHGFGPVIPEKDEPVFHHEWEARVLAMSRAMRITRAWNGDTSRYAKEVLPPDVYLGSPYYKRWLLGLEWLTVKAGLVGADEIAAGRALRPGVPFKAKNAGSNDPHYLAKPTFERPAPAPALFAQGQQVRARNIHPPTHTRLPRYARGHVGVIEHVHSCFVFADSNAEEKGEDPQWVYTVRFTGRELWGPDADPMLSVSIDAFEPYLERA